MRSSDSTCNKLLIVLTLVGTLLAGVGTWAVQTYFSEPRVKVIKAALKSGSNIVDITDKLKAIFVDKCVGRGACKLSIGSEEMPSARELIVEYECASVFSSASHRKTVPVRHGNFDILVVCE